MSQWVEITFDCIPLRLLREFVVPAEASPKYRQKCERVLAALAKHGAKNSYYLTNGRCTFHLLNHDTEGMLEFEFVGTVLTDEGDLHTVGCDVQAELARETCDWINAPIVDWFAQTVERAVMREFDRYIAAGDLAKTLARVEQDQAAQDAAGGYVGMYL